MNVLITGGTGYIGSQIAQDLARRGHQVTVLARPFKKGVTQPERFQGLQASGVTIVGVDLSTPGDLTRVLDPGAYDVIVHGVCSFLEPTTHESLTLRAMTEVVGFAQKAPKLKQVIDLGNCLVLADAGASDVPDEDYPCRPNTLHGRNKLQAERMLQTSGVPWVVLRVGQVYGGRGSSFDWVVLNGIRTRTLPLPGNGHNRVGLVHVEDVSQAVWRVIEQGHQNLTLNISSADTTVTQGQVFDLVADSFGVPRPQRIPRPAALAYAWVTEQSARLRGKEPAFIPDMIKVLSGNWLLSINRAVQVLGYTPAYPRTLEGIGAAYADAFAGRVPLFTPPQRWSEVRGTRND